MDGEWVELSAVLASLGPGDRVLEVGTGPGTLFRTLLGLLDLGHGWRLTTLDVDPDAADAARVRAARLPARLAGRVQVVRADVVDWAKAPGDSRPPYDVVVGSALLSAAAMVRAGGAAEVLDSLASLTGSNGTLLLEDYLPLAVPPQVAADRAREAWPPADLAVQDLWRWYKAVAELLGNPHYQEVPPRWVRQRLVDRGFHDVHVASDERQAIRPPDEFTRLAATDLPRPPAIDESLWFALDRYRRRCIEAIAAGGGLVQWSGWYRVTARR